MATAKRTDPDLWAQVKREVTRGDKGGEPGQWSARKAQMAVQLYKARGGGYADDGPGQGDTDLHGWTEADWGTRSGAESGESGERYLPKKIRMLLTDDEYRRTTAKKAHDTHRNGAQFSDQPEDVRAKVAQIRESGPTKAMVAARARELGIAGRSKMSKERLLAEIGKATDGEGRAPGGRDALRRLPVRELRRRARTAGIDGRSKMSKDDLVAALAD